MSSLTPLVSLPQELQDLIMSFLDHSLPRQCRKNDILNLSLACKALRATCLRAIFEDVYLGAWTTNHWHFCPRRILALTKSCTASAAGLGQTIKKIRIQDLDPLDQTLERLFQHTPCLTSLSIHYALQFHKDRDLPHIHTSRLASALAGVATSLTRLDVKYNLSFMSALVPTQHSIPPAVPHTACSWTHMTALEYLEIPPSVLLGWKFEHAPPLVDILPRGLVGLHIGMDVWWQFKDRPHIVPVDAILSDLVEGEKWRRITPALKNVSGYLRPEQQPHMFASLQAKRKALRALLERNGLHYNEDIRRVVDEAGGLKKAQRRELLEAEGIVIPPTPPGTIVDFFE